MLHGGSSSIPSLGAERGAKRSESEGINDENEPSRKILQEKTFDPFRESRRSDGPLFEDHEAYEFAESGEFGETDLFRAHESRAVERAGECASAHAQTSEQFSGDLLVLKDIFSDMYLSEALDEDRKEKVVVIGGISRVRRDFALQGELGEKKVGVGGRKEPVRTFSRKSGVI